MGQTLLNTQINNTYPSLLKTSDNAVIGATEKVIGDGLGNDSTLSLGTASASFTGTLALGSATVTGLDGLNPAGGTADQVLTKIDGTDYNYEWRDAGGGGAAGLVTGGQTNSMKSAAALTTNPATTLNDGDIALGENARITTTTANEYSDGGNVVIGKNAFSVKAADASFDNTEGGVAIGDGAETIEYWPASGGGGVAIGPRSEASAAGTVSVGTNSRSTGTKNVAIGFATQSTGGSGVALGTDADSIGYAGVAVGQNSRVTAGGFQEAGIAIGTYNTVSANSGVVIGNQSTSGQAGGIVIGDDITADKQDTVHIKALDLATASTPTAGGIVFTDAGGTERRMNIDASGGLQIDSTPVGGGGGGITAVSNLTETSHAGPDSADNVFVSLTIPANTFAAGDVVQLSTLTTQDFTGAGWIYNGLWISNSTTFGTGVNIASNESTSNQSYLYQKIGYIKVADGTGNGTSWMGGTGDRTDQWNNGSNSFSDNDNVSIDWTSTVYVNLSCFVDNASSSITNKGMNIVKIN